MKCLNPILIPNPKVKAHPDTFNCYDDAMIWVPCGRCLACRKQRASSWRVRLIKEWQLGQNNNAIFVTFTFDEDSYSRFYANDSVNRAIRLFLERVRKYLGHSVRHWLITELGEIGGRLHLHGIIWNCNFDRKTLESLWSYGFIWVGEVNVSTCNYVVKYLLKQQQSVDGRQYEPRVFCSPGIGACYLTENSMMYHRRSGDTTIRMNGYIFCMPRYYYTKIFFDSNYSSKLSSIFKLSPPTYRVGKTVFNDFVSYEQFVKKYYEDTLKRGSSLPLKFIDNGFISKGAYESTENI